MNILYINHYAGSIYHGMEYRPYYLAREWVKMGHNVTMVAGNISHIRQKNIEIPETRNYIEENIDGIRYIWCKTTPYQTNGAKRLINILSFLRQVWNLRDTISDGIKYDMVIASSTYPYDTLLAKEFAKRHQAKFVYEVHDLWPLTPMEVGGMSKWHPFIMTMQWAENYGYQHADKVVSLLPKADSYMHEHGMVADKFIYISNGVVVNDWLNATQTLPTAHSDLLKELKQQGKVIIGYAGGMGEANALNYLLMAARQISDKPIAIVLIGDGPNRQDLINYAKEHNLTNVHFLPAIGKLQIPAFLTACDALYIGWNKLPIYRFGICPNKLFDYMLAKKPVIHSVTAGNDIVAMANCGISVAAEDVTGIADAMRQIACLTPEQYQQFGENGYNYVLANHDYKVLATRFIDEVFSR